MKKRIAFLLPFVLLSTFAFAGAPGHVAAAPSTPNKVVDFETIIGSLNTDGSLYKVRLIDDLRVFGNGDVTVTDPRPTADLRNLLGFSGPTVVGDGVRYHLSDLDGSAEFVTASTPGADLPMAMGVKYSLDGENVSEGQDLVGDTGDVRIQFTVTDTTTKTETVTFKDATGGKQTAEVQVPIPMVAQLQLVLPPDHFTRVDAPGADILTDPSGNKIVNWSMVMVPPIGETTQTFTLDAHTEDFRMGQIRLVGAPVAPNDREFLRYAETQLGGGVDSTTSLYSGATEIADNLDKLHAGTVKLLGGMEKLYAGSQKLTAGLLKAVTGSGQLATGLGAAGSGSGQLTAGLQKLFAGSGLLTSGLGEAVAGVGSASQNLTIVGGLTDLRAGLLKLLAGLNLLKAGLPAAKDAALGIQQIANALAPLLTTGSNSIKGGATGIQTIANQLTTLLNGAAQACAADPDKYCSTVQFTPGFTIQSALQFVSTCLTGGTTSACGTNVPSVSTIAGLISAGADQIATCLAGSGLNSCGVAKPSIATIAGLLAGGVDEALAGLGSPTQKNTLIWGMTQAVAGTEKLIAGSEDLGAGLAKAETGSSKITAGLGLAHAGSVKLTAGLGGQAAPGAEALHQGLGDAHEGSALITGGLGKAKTGTSQVEQGVYAINELGVKEIARSANDTALQIGQDLALLKAQDRRAQNQSLFYGMPASEQADSVVGGSGVVLVLDALDGREADTVTRNIYVGFGLLLLLGLALLGVRGARRAVA